jgi:preprotein translocase subunit SecF
MLFSVMKGVISAANSAYDKHYRKLLIIPVLFFIFSIIVIGNHYLKTGEFVSKGVSLKGGTTVSIDLFFDTNELSNYLIQKFPDADIGVRTLSKAGADSGVIVEASDIESGDLLAAIQEKTGSLSQDQYTIDTTGPSLGEAFFKQAIISVLFAFLLISLVVYIYFRAPLPGFYAVFSVFADALFALAMFIVFNYRLTTAGIAAFLMLIGYSIDTDILLTTRVLKRKEGTVSERMASALPTGLTMTFAALVAVLVGYYSTSSELLKQIMFILGWGLVADIVFTWLFNAPLLRMYVEKKEKLHGEQK